MPTALLKRGAAQQTITGPLRAAAARADGLFDIGDDAGSEPPGADGEDGQDDPSADRPGGCASWKCVAPKVPTTAERSSTLAASARRNRPR